MLYILKSTNSRDQYQMTCPLCSSESSIYAEDKKRLYRQCSNCHLVFVPDSFILSSEKEKSEYDLHQNDPYDEGYRKFLNRVFNPVTETMKPPATGLDFGCGPGPALYHMFKEQKYEMSLYDLYYYPDKSPLGKTYDFITCTEVIEHIKDPIATFETLFNCLKPNGLLALMTKMVKDKEAFGAWHYKNDPTHIRFYSQQTFRFIAEKFNTKVEFIDKDVIIFRNKKTSFSQVQIGKFQISIPIKFQNVMLTCANMITHSTHNRFIQFGPLS
jgi:SAM-dependent methyltransferase